MILGEFYTIIIRCRNISKIELILLSGTMDIYRFPVFGKGGKNICHIRCTK